MTAEDKELLIRDLCARLHYGVKVTTTNPAVENFVKSKREELEKMIPSFVDDRKFTDIVLNFYERGIRDGTQMILERMEALKEAVDAEIVEKP